MKKSVLFIGIGASISLSKTGGISNYERVSLAASLVDDNVDVYAATTASALSKHFPELYPLVPVDKLKFIDLDTISSLTQYDSIIVNGSCNLFGGAPSDEMLDQFYLLAQLPETATINSLVVDLEVAFTQLWTNIHGKLSNPAGSVYSQWVDWKARFEAKHNITFNVEDIERLFKVKAKIRYISQGRDLIKTQRSINKSAALDQFVHIPLEKWILTQNTTVNTQSAEDTKEFDLVYGGSGRGGNRESKLTKFYVNSGLKTLFFGTIKPKHIGLDENNLPENITFEGKVKPQQMAEQNNKALATVIIGDDSYDNNMITLRVWESILSGVLTFVDVKFDPNMNIYKNEMLREWLYVTDGQDLNDRITFLKSNKTYLEALRILVQEELNEFNKDEWRLEFHKALNLR